MVWFFDRGSEQLTLQIGRNAPRYELHVRRSDGTRVLAFVGAVDHLVEQLHAVPQALLAAGWRPRPQKSTGR